MMTTINLWQNSSENHLMIEGPEGQLESSLTIPENNTKNHIAIICHPHSLHGGTMNNKVITTLAKIFNNLGIPTLRFNFRGVGESQGHFAEGIGEVEDLRSVISWVKKQRPHIKIALAGFSFGSFVAYQMSQQIDSTVLVTVAPPIHHFLYDDKTLPSCPWIVVQGESDEIVPAEQVFNWINQLPREVTLLRFPQTDHFFHGKLMLLRDLLQPVLKKALVNTSSE